jgi:hypothetical protein
MTQATSPRGERYTKVKLNISQGQQEKIKKAAHDDSAVTLRLSHDDLSGDHILALTSVQINKMKKAYEEGKGITLNLSKTQLAHNMKVEGGFLPALLGVASTILPFLAKTALPALATGALSTLGSEVVSKAMSKGSALYIKKGNHSAKIIKAGRGLYLSPWKKGESQGTGLYIKTGKGTYNIAGEGLILGPDSPFKNIPILGLIL